VLLLDEKGQKPFVFNKRNDFKVILELYRAGIGAIKDAEARENGAEEKMTGWPFLKKKP
jgi:hypothetical protein